MLNINMEDVLGVVNACKPQLIALAVVLVLAAAVLIAMAVNRRIQKADRFFIRWNAVLALVLAVGAIANWVCLGPMSNLISLTMGSATVSDETTAQAIETAEQIAGEGFVLLENEDNLLPLEDVDQLNLFGWASVNPVYGGAGSGGINDLYEKEFFYAVSYSAAMNLHLKILDGGNNHHMAEALFKAFGKALDMAVSEEPRMKEVWSTKGSL